jgi:hypothetical protein
MQMGRARKKGARKGRAGIFRPGGRSHRGLFGRRSESGFFGVDAAIMIAFIVILISMLIVAIPGIITWFVSAFAQSLEFPVLLVHVPGIAGQPLYDATVVSEIGSLNSGITGAASSTMEVLYPKMQLVAFVAFIIAAIVVGITYVSEQFNLVSKGTAFQLLSESGLILVLLFIFPIIYNAAAAAVNGLNQCWILPVPASENAASQTASQVINTVAGSSAPNVEIGWANFGAALLPGVNVLNVGPVLLAIVEAVGSLGVIFMAFLTGVGRLLLTAVLVSIFPLFLVFRLIPPLRRIATETQGALIGLMVGTIVVSLIMRVTYGILVGPGIPKIMLWALGCGALALAAVMMYQFTQTFRGAGRALSTAGGAMGAVAGGAVTMGAGVAAAAGLAAPFTGATAAGIPGSLSSKLAMMGRGTLAAGQAGMGGPVSAVIKGPLAGREAVYGEAGKQLLKEVGDTKSMFIKDFNTNKEHLNARSALKNTPNFEAMSEEFGHSRLEEIRDNRATLEELQRATAEASGRPVKVVKEAKLTREELRSGILAAHSEIASNKGSKEADLWLESLFNRASGREPFPSARKFGGSPKHGGGAPSKAGGKTEPENAPLTAEQEIKDSYITARERAQRRMADHEGARKRRSLSKD